MKILFIGDIVGKGGREAVRALTPGLRREYGCDFCIANAENIAGGSGMNKNCLQALFDGEVDVCTSGDHVWDQKQFAAEIESLPNVLRPANYPGTQPGKGYGVYTSESGQQVAVLCLLGRTFMAVGAECPFAAAERIVPELKKITPLIVIDFHAEASSEKIALGRFLDGQVSAVLGTHTHVPTADQQVFPGGTAFQCDVGMVGARESVIGRALQPVIARFRHSMPQRFSVVEKGIRLHGCVVSVDDKGRARGIERVLRDLP
ncbi:MAG: TIGR00282 family metallophosphoesterase [Lentisphaeria bacterium]|jgi:metallophosphoesterase (TIGR00282 family)|nr:TIGR00282 family metallophosphoesterase [Lentisphaeria bacterium]MDY0176904.1 TIGR00282 family metallophosphoesterase [Lentisphaeria bacterium]NLZ59815.1 YmdB family metallophosphoesterase [Lentisphaerota bacterium]